MNMEEKIKEISDWLQEKVIEAGAKGVVFGLSGGIDSAVVAGIAVRTFPETSLGIIMPCHSNDEDEEHANILAKALDLKTSKVDLSYTFDTLIESTDIFEYNELAMSNIKPRLRMTTLYYYAQVNNYLVIGPTNKSELTTGYFTKHGDSGVDLLPIADFVKEEIYEMAEILEIPEIIIEKEPSAGLVENQTDEDEMGFSYEKLDGYIKTGENKDEITDKIDTMYARSSHKRNYPPIFKNNK